MPVVIAAYSNLAVGIILFLIYAILSEGMAL
jgi:hypothetical protein